MGDKPDVQLRKNFNREKQDEEDWNVIELKGILDSLSHIVWLKNNIDKYEMGEWAVIKRRVLGGDAIDNYETMEKYYMAFFYHFVNNPYVYSSPIKKNEGNITSLHPECYFVRIKLNGQKESKAYYIPLGFLEELKTMPEVKMSDVKLAKIVRGFLEEERRKFWVYTYSKVERVFLNNFYECYKDDWKTGHGWKTGEVRKGNRKHISMVNYILMAILIVFIIMCYANLREVPVYYEVYKNKMLLLSILAVSIVEICCISASICHKIKCRLYGNVINAYEKDKMYQRCCDEVENKFSLWLKGLSDDSMSEPLDMVMPKEYLSNLERKLKIKVGNGIIGAKASVVIFLIGLIILAYFYFNVI